MTIQSRTATEIKTDKLTHIFNVEQYNIMILTTPWDAAALGMPSLTIKLEDEASGRFYHMHGLIVRETAEKPQRFGPKMGFSNVPHSRGERNSFLNQNAGFSVDALTRRIEQEVVQMAVVGMFRGFSPEVNSAGNYTAKVVDIDYPREQQLSALTNEDIISALSLLGVEVEEDKAFRGLTDRTIAVRETIVKDPGSDVASGIALLAKAEPVDGMPNPLTAAVVRLLLAMKFNEGEVVEIVL